MLVCTFEDGNKASLRHATVDTVVVKDGKILLVKRSMKLSNGGMWGLPGGYMDLNETLKEGAAREVLEETGWTVKGMQLMTIRDKPDRAGEDRQNITAAYLAEAVEKVGEPDWESDEVRWFTLDELPPTEEIAFDHHDIISLYKKYLDGSVTLPLLD